MNHNTMRRSTVTCSFCGQRYDTIDPSHLDAAKGTLYACAGEIARLNSAQRYAAHIQHEQWLAKQRWR